MPALALFFGSAAQAHGIAGSGLLHPLTGLDHLLAMVAVGAWSAQLGGRALYAVPLAFMAAMLAGGLIGFGQVPLPLSEPGIALSVLLLGLAIGFERRAALLIASAGVAIFGICHGHAHGLELPVAQDRWDYAGGFMLTTGSLHLIGACGAQLVLRHAHGGRWLRAAGLATAGVGGVLLCAV